MSPSANRVEVRALFEGLQAAMLAELNTSRQNLTHAPTLGGVTEQRWAQLLTTYLPKRYCVSPAFVLDSEGSISDQIDLVIYDRHFSPFLFHQEGATYIPAESVYAILEVKQELSRENIRYAGAKIASVRRLKRTSAAITHAGGRFEPRPPPPILGGLVATSSSWASLFGRALIDALSELEAEQQVDVGCSLTSGTFTAQYPAGKVAVEATDATDGLITFFLNLLSRLQSVGTVPAMDIAAYSASLPPCRKLE